MSMTLLLRFPAITAEPSALISPRDEGSWQLLGCRNGAYSTDIQPITCDPRRRTGVKHLLAELEVAAVEMSVTLSLTRDI